MTTDTQKLAAILGADNEKFTLTIRGEKKEFPVSPFEGWQMLEVLKCIDALSDAGIITDEVGGALHKSFNQYKVFTRGGDHAFRALAVAVTPEEDTTQIDEMAALLRKAKVVDLIKLFGKVYKRNKDFFVQNQDEVLELFGVTKEQVGQLKEGYSSIKSLLNSFLEASRSVKSGDIPSPKLQPSE